MRANTLVGCAALVACSSHTPPHDYTAGTQAGSPWPVIGHDEGYTGRASVVGARTSNIKWKLDTGAFIGTASPVVAADGTIYIGNSAGSFNAVHPNGALAWTRQIGGVESAATIASDGSIYVASDDTRLHVFAADGSEVSAPRTTDSIQSSVLLDDQGLAYFSVAGLPCTAERQGPIVCDAYLGATSTVSSLGLPFAIAANHFYVASYDGSLVTYDTTPPQGDAGVTVGEGTLGAITEDGTMFLESSGRLEVHDSSFTYLWSCDIPRFRTHDTFTNQITVAVASSTLVFLTSPTGLAALAPSGAVWSLDLGAAIEDRPATDSEGAVFVGASDGKLYAFDATGIPLFTVQTGNAIRSSPAIGADGTVYFGSDDGFLYAVGP